MAHENDPRIQTIFDMLEAWKAHPDKPEGAEGFDSLMTQMLALVDWSSVSLEAARKVILTIASEPDSDELIGAMAAEAGGDRYVYLQTTVGHDIAEALQKCGVSNPAIAEELAHKAIREALAAARETDGVATEVQ